MPDPIVTVTVQESNPDNHVNLDRGDWRKSDAARDSTEDRRTRGKGFYFHLRTFERDSGSVPVSEE